MISISDGGSLLLTSTESVAEFTRRPLLSITAADLSQDPMKLEENLLKFFANAQDWDAIVLLDEADVYLESRQLRDMWHNGMVSGTIDSPQEIIAFNLR